MGLKSPQWSPVGYFEACRMSNSMKLSRWDYLKWIVRFGVYDFRRYLWFYAPSFHSPLVRWPFLSLKWLNLGTGMSLRVGPASFRKPPALRELLPTHWPQRQLGLVAPPAWRVSPAASQRRCQVLLQKLGQVHDSGRILHNANIHQIQPTCCVKTQGMKFGILRWMGFHDRYHHHWYSISVSPTIQVII